MTHAGTYHDKNGTELHDGDVVVWDSGRKERLYAWRDGNETGLGVDATNPHWIEAGRAYPCEYGIYPLTEDDLEEIEKA